MNGPHLAVCGLGRCGSSALMHMLAMGGVPVAGEWPAYEPEELGGVRLLEGHAVKILRLHQGAQRPHWAIWLDRDHKQQAVSAWRFLGREPSRTEVRAMMGTLRRERSVCHRILNTVGAEVLRVCFEDIIQSPWTVAVRVRQFAYMALGVEASPEAMVAAVHRRSPAALQDPWERRISGGGR